MKLSVENVINLFDQCVRHDDTKGTTVEGIVHSACLDVSGHEDEIGQLLKQLPLDFQPISEGGGGGMTFLNMCNDRDGNLWTGMHVVMEQLCLLGLAAGKAEWCLPREIWKSLPGGVPYVMVK